jgi:hypothetical protein
MTMEEREQENDKKVLMKKVGGSKSRKQLRI